MTENPPPLPSDPPYEPSLVGPIFITALGAAVMFLWPALMGGDTGACCTANCCASLLAASLAVMPVMVLRRRGGYPTAGTGCLVGFFGVGIGGIVGAIVQASFPSYDLAELRAAMDQGYDELVRQSESQGQPVPFTREEFVDNAVAMAPYFVILIVAFSSFLAGAIGMLVASLGKRRPPPQHPQYPQPPQYPPQSPQYPPQPPQV